MIWWQGSVWTLDHLFWADLALGPAVACLLGGLATGHAALLLRLLNARPIRNLGRPSYSLYLTHGPIAVVVSRRSPPAGSATVSPPSSYRSPSWCR